MPANPPHKIKHEEVRLRLQQMAAHDAELARLLASPTQKLTPEEKRVRWALHELQYGVECCRALREQDLAEDV